MPDATICRRLLVHGMVQGVGYRWSMVSEAERIGGLAGWVRNRRDGTGAVSYTHLTLPTSDLV